MYELDKASWHIFIARLRGSILFGKAFGPRNSKPGRFSKGKARDLIGSQSERFSEIVEAEDFNTKREVSARIKSFLFLLLHFNLRLYLKLPSPIPVFIFLLIIIIFISLGRNKLKDQLIE